jgi:hypothetical protein
MKENREEAIAAIRELADLLEAHDALPVPFGLDGGSSMNVFLHDGDAPQRLAELTRLLAPCEKMSEEWGTGIQALIGGVIRLQVTADRELVCERVVIGEREVTREVPAPGAEMVTVTEVEEIVEWRCPESFLALAQPA